MTRSTGMAGLGLKIRVPAALLLTAFAVSTAANVKACEEPAKKPATRVAEAPAPKPAPARPPRTSVSPARPAHAKAPPPAAEEPLPFFGPRGALAPHVV